MAGETVICNTIYFEPIYIECIKPDCDCQVSDSRARQLIFFPSSSVCERIATTPGGCTISVAPPLNASPLRVCWVARRLADPERRGDS